MCEFSHETFMMCFFTPLLLLCINNNREEFSFRIKKERSEHYYHGYHVQVNYLNAYNWYSRYFLLPPTPMN
jgi:hypothetical protein